MNRALLARLNRLLHTVPSGPRRAYLRALLGHAFGLNPAPDGADFEVSENLHAHARALLQSYTPAPDATENALTPEILALLHEQNAPQRKARGIFYTPWPLADLLAEQTLFFALTRQAGLSENDARALLGRGKTPPRKAALQRFLANLRVCDPAAGAGGLLLPFALRLARLRAALTPHTTAAEILSDIFARNLCAADTDREALEILQLRARLLLPRNARNAAPVAHAFCADVLQFPQGENGPVLPRQAFDIILANPPFVGQKNHAALFGALKQNPFWATKIAPKSDLLYLFFYLALALLKPQGVAGFITPPYFTTSAGGAPLRRRLRQDTALLRLIDFGPLRLFAEAGPHTLLSVFQKTAQRPVCLTGLPPAAVPQQDLYNGPDAYLQTRPAGQAAERILLRNMAACPRTLADTAEVSNGLMTGCDKISAAHLRHFPDLGAPKGTGVFILSAREKQQLRLNATEAQKLKPFFKNSDISAYTANEEAHYFLVDIFYPKDRQLNWARYPHLWQHLQRFKPVLCARRQNNSGIDKALAQGQFWFGSVRRKMNFEGEKLLVPHRARTNTFAYSNGPWYASSDVYFIANPVQGVSLWYLLALFNSRPYAVWLARNGKRKGNLLELYASPLKQLPVPQAAPAQMRELETLARRIFRLKKQNKPTGAPQHRIDALVCALFGLSAAQTRKVCPF